MKSNRQNKEIIIFVISIFLISLLVACSNNDKNNENIIQNVSVDIKDIPPAELQIIIQESPPFSYTSDGEFTGFVTEIVKELMAVQNITTPFTVLPFKRGYELVSEEAMTVLCGMTRTEDREELFKWVGPVAQVTTGFYAKADADITLTSIEDAKAVESVGVTLGYYTENLLHNENFENLDPVSYPDDMLDKLMLGRSTLIFSDNIAMSGLMINADITPTDLEMVFEVLSTESYLAFSLGTPDEIIKEWQDAFDQAYKDGIILDIYNEFLPNVIPPSLNR